MARIGDTQRARDEALKILNTPLRFDDDLNGSSAVYISSLDNDLTSVGADVTSLLSKDFAEKPTILDGLLYESRKDEKLIRMINRLNEPTAQRLEYNSLKSLANKMAKRLREVEKKMGEASQTYAIGTDAQILDEQAKIDVAYGLFGDMVKSLQTGEAPSNIRPIWIGEEDFEHLIAHVTNELEGIEQKLNDRPGGYENDMHRNIARTVLIDDAKKSFPALLKDRNITVEANYDDIGATQENLNFLSTLEGEGAEIDELILSQLQDALDRIADIMTGQKVVQRGREGGGGS